MEILIGIFVIGAVIYFLPVIISVFMTGFLAVVLVLTLAGSGLYALFKRLFG